MNTMESLKMFEFKKFVNKLWDTLKYFKIYQMFLITYYPFSIKVERLPQARCTIYWPEKNTRWFNFKDKDNMYKEQ